MLLSSENGLELQLAAKLKDGVLVSLNGANVKDKLQAQQIQAKLGGAPPPIHDEVSSVKEQIAAEQVNNLLYIHFCRIKHLFPLVQVFSSMLTTQESYST